MSAAHAGTEEAGMDHEEAIPVKRRELQQIAQMIHQGYHEHIGGTWRECPIGVCGRIRSLLRLPDCVPGADPAPPAPADEEGFAADLAEPVSGETLVRMADALGMRLGRDACAPAREGERHPDVRIPSAPEPGETGGG